MAIGRVLVADPSPSARDAMRRILEQHGLQVLVATSAEDALLYAGRYDPDAIFVDQDLPRQSGLKLVDELRGTPETAHIPVVLTVSGQGQGAGRKPPRGVTAVLAKAQTSVRLAKVLEALEAEARRRATTDKTSQAMRAEADDAVSGMARQAANEVAEEVVSRHLARVEKEVQEVVLQLQAGARLDEVGRQEAVAAARSAAQEEVERAVAQLAERRVAEAIDAHMGRLHRRLWVAQLVAALAAVGLAIGLWLR